MIKLEYFGPEDFSQLINWIKDEELLKNWSGSLFSFPLTPASLDWYLEGSNHEGAEVFIYKVIEDTTGQVVGHISLGGISKKNNSARISRVLVDTAHRGKGYCYHMITAVLKFGFENLKLHRISLGVYDFNTSAIKCYLSAGMVVEGTHREILFFKGQWWSLVELSMLNKEWKLKHPSLVS